MAEKILVAYATRHGATAEIADQIGQALREAGLEVDVLEVKGVGDLGPYRAVVLGSAVYAGQWRREAAAFLRVNERALAGRPLWIFSSGPTGPGDPLQLLQGWRFPEALRPIADRLRPRDIAVFGGALDAQKLNPLEKLLIKMVKAPFGDFRDWAAITAWAQAIAADLRKGA